MEVLEGYARTLEAVEELRAEGIETKIIPSRSDSVEPDDVLPRDKWVNIEFYPKNAAQVEAISRKADELGWFGIAFDTGGSAGQRDWELDWSFHVNPTPDPEWELRRRDVEDLIEGRTPEDTALD